MLPDVSMTKTTNLGWALACSKNAILQGGPPHDAAKSDFLRSCSAESGPATVTLSSVNPGCELMAGAGRDRLVVVGQHAIHIGCEGLLEHNRRERCAIRAHALAADRNQGLFIAGVEARRERRRSRHGFRDVFPVWPPRSSSTSLPTNRRPVPGTRENSNCRSHENRRLEAGDRQIERQSRTASVRLPVPGFIINDYRELRVSGPGSQICRRQAGWAAKGKWCRRRLGRRRRCHRWGCCWLRC